MVPLFELLYCAAYAGYLTLARQLRRAMKSLWYSARQLSHVRRTLAPWNFYCSGGTTSKISPTP